GEGVHRVFVAHAIGPACSRPAPRISPPNESPSPSAICAAGLRRSRRKASSPKSTPRSTGTSSSAPSCGWRKGPAPARRSSSTTSRTTTRRPAAAGRVFGSALNNYRRIAMMLGLPPDTHPRELVKIGRTILSGSIPPKIVATGAVKENILKGTDVDLYEFPTPYWNRLDGGRYLLTYGGCVTKDPETGIMNV